MIEKVEGPGSVRGTQATRETRRTARPSAAAGTAFVKHLDPAQEAETPPVGGVGSLGAVSAIAGLQEVDDALARATRGKTRAKDILDRLEDLRLELLLGGVSKARLQQLARMVAQRRPDVADPRLAEILDDIDLRAQVELAKLGC